MNCAVCKRIEPHYEIDLLAKSHLLNKAGDVAARLFRPSEEGFIVKTTCKLFITY